MQKWKSLHPALKIAIVIFSFMTSILVFPQSSTAGYVTLFVGLIGIFQAFPLSLFWKIMIALGLGISFALSGLFPDADLIAIRPIGSKIFLNFLTMALVPLVFASIVTGVTSLGDISRLNRIGFRTMFYYLFTTAVSITIGLTLANVIAPGKNLTPEVRETFESSFKASASTKLQSAQQSKKTTFETIQGLVPKNIFSTISDPKPEMLALIFFAIVSGLALLKMDPATAEPVINVLKGITDMSIQIVIMAMTIAPYGVFAIIASTVAENQSIELLYTLIPFSLTVLLGLFTHAILTNGFSLMFLSKRPVVETMLKMREVLVTAFSTSSSGGTMPFTMKTTEQELGVSKPVSGFVIPLGATINMDGTALFQGVSAIFLANIYGIPLTLFDQVSIVGLAVVASIGTAAVPGVGIVILTLILVAVRIPPEGILFIRPVNNILDMARTAVNVMGDMTCAIYIDAVEKQREESTTSPSTAATQELNPTT